jgi:hypothetical protein
LRILSIYINKIFNLISASSKELSAHIASVKSILENHASYLMSGKELSKLVAFVKGTQFDLVVSSLTRFLQVPLIILFSYIFNPGIQF